MDILFVTTGRVLATPDELAAQPLNGSLFVVHDIPPRSSNRWDLGVGRIQELGLHWALCTMQLIFLWDVLGQFLRLSLSVSNICE